MLFARNLLLARLVSVEDYGVASTFAIAMAVVEMSTQFGLHVQIVQDKRGEDPAFQAALQGFQVLRGVIAGLLLFVLAGAMADLMNIPQVAWAYQVMALLPVLKSLQHFDIHRLNRDMRFGPLLLTGGLSAFASLLALYPLAMWLGDYRAMLYALVLQALLELVISHLTADRKYRMVLDRAVISGSIRFGWPLLTNGVLLFLVFQGDRVIVGRELGIEVLAVFSMGVTLSFTPALVMTKSIQNFFLGPLSRDAELRKTAPGTFQNSAEAVIQGNLVSGAALIIGALFLGPWFIYVALPPEYTGLSWMLIWMVIQQGVRVFKSGPNLVSLSCGYTLNELATNGIRVLSLSAIWWAASTGLGLPVIFAIAIAAEALGVGIAVILMQWKIKIGLTNLWPSFFISLALVAVTATSQLPHLQAWSVECSVLAAGLFILLLASAKSFRRHFHRATR